MHAELHRHRPIVDAASRQGPSGAASTATRSHARNVALSACRLVNITHLNASGFVRTAHLCLLPTLGTGHESVAGAMVAVMSHGTFVNVQLHLRRLATFRMYQVRSDRRSPMTTSPRFGLTRDAALRVLVLTLFHRMAAVHDKGLSEIAQGLSLAREHDLDHGLDLDPALASQGLDTRTSVRSPPMSRTPVHCNLQATRSNLCSVGSFRLRLVALQLCHLHRSRHLPTLRWSSG